MYIDTNSGYHVIRGWPKGCPSDGSTWNCR